MKLIITILLILTTFSLRSETYAEFLKRFIPGNIITIPSSNGVRIKIKKIDDETIYEIKIYQYDKENKLKKEIFAEKATIYDKGKGVAVLKLTKAVVKHYPFGKGFIDRSHFKKLKLRITYQVIIKIKGKDYDITESIKK